MKSLFILPLIFLLQACGSYRVAFVGDPQVDNETELTYARESIYSELRERSDIGLAVFLGDLVNDDVRFLEPTRATLDSLPYPWTCVPGNHDRDFYGKKKGKIVSIDGAVNESRPRDMATYSRVISAPDTTFVHSGVRFIMMDDVRRVGKLGYEGGFREDQKKWLEAVLADTPGGMLAVLSAHIPFSQFGALDSLEAILSKHPKTLLMCGHTHTMARHTLKFPGGLAMEEVLTGASCGSWWRGRPDSHGIPSATQNCGAPRAYYIADFSPRGYRLSAKVVGESPTLQASAWIADSTRLVVNVYAGADDGKVQVKIPGVSGWIDVPHRREPAPEAYEVVAFNRTLPAQRSHNPLFIPMLTVGSPHIWAVNFARNAELCEALKEGTVIEIRYEDASMSFDTSARLQVSPGHPSKKRKK